MKKILLLLADGFEIFEASVFIDVCGWNLVDGDGNTRLEICGRQKEISGTFGVRIIADLTISELNVDDYDALAIPGGFIEYHFYEHAYKADFLSVIRAFHEKGKLIASICTGALPVA